VGHSNLPLEEKKKKKQLSLYTTHITNKLLTQILALCWQSSESLPQKKTDCLRAVTLALLLERVKLVILSHTYE
jgi:hypothetical protein